MSPSLDPRDQTLAEAHLRANRGLGESRFGTSASKLLAELHEESARTSGRAVDPALGGGHGRMVSDARVLARYRSLMHTSAEQQRSRAEDEAPSGNMHEGDEEAPQRRVSSSAQHCRA
jgi:hypothetical protein